VRCKPRRGLARAIIQYVNFQSLDKDFYLLDTFDGLRDELISDDERSTGILPGRYQDCYDEVVRTFSRFARLRIIRGAIPSTLEQITAQRVCFLSIDMDCVAPEIAALRFCWGKLVKGAVVVLDDYG